MGTTYARHGGAFTGWWAQTRCENPPQVVDSITTEKWCVAVYVVKETMNVEKLRLDCMRYIGGQEVALCSPHRLPLIIAVPLRAGNVPTKLCSMVSSYLFFF